MPFLGCASRFFVDLARVQKGGVLLRDREAGEAVRFGARRRVRSRREVAKERRGDGKE